MSKTSLTRGLLALALTLCLGILTGCQQPTGPQVAGEISAQITGHGLSDKRRASRWQVIRDGRQSRSQWQGKTKNGSVILFGQLPGLEKEKATVGSIAIRFEYTSELGEQPSARIRYYIDGVERRSFASKDKGNATVHIESVEFDGDEARLRGTFSAMMPFRLSGKSIVDNVREFSDGKFDVVVPVVSARPQVTTVSNSSK